MYIFVAVLLILAEVGIAAYFAYQGIVKKRLLSKKNLIFLAPVFVISYTMFMTASVFKGVKIDYLYCFSLCDIALDFFKFDIDRALLAPLFNAHPIYIAVFVMLAVLAVFTLIVSIASFFATEIKSRLLRSSAFRSGGDIVIGYSPSSLEYMKNSKKSGYKTVLWAEKLEKTEYKQLIGAGYAVCCAPLTPANVLKKLRGREHHMIAFRDSGYSYVDLINFFQKVKSKRASLLYLHVEATVDEMRVVKDKYVANVDESSNSFVTCFSRHELMARDFVTEYPISKFVPREFFDEDFALREGKKINVAFIGFGKVGYELFKTLAAQFQFARKDKSGKLKSAPVNYYIYDRESRRMYNDYLFKLVKFNDLFEDADLPMPESVCSISWPKTDEDVRSDLALDVNSVEAHRQMRKLTGENDFTYFIVSLSDDLEDESYARSMRAYLGERDNYKIFVRVKKTNGVFDDGFGVTAFGDESRVLTHECIVNEYLMSLSQDVNRAYNDCSRIDNIREWEKLPVVEQYSNISSALNIPFKLALLGFDVQEDGAPTSPETLALFKKRYNDLSAGKKKPYSFFSGTNACNVLAFIEHSRWNAFYIFSDFTQLKLSQFIIRYKNGCPHTPENIQKLDHKDLARLKHACITDYYEGLDKLIRFKYLALKHLSDGGKLDGESVKKLMKESSLKSVPTSALDENTGLYDYDFGVMDRVCGTLGKFGRRLVELGGGNAE